MHDLPWCVSIIMKRVMSRQHYHQAAVKAAMDRGFAGLTANRNNATTWGAEHVPSNDDFVKVRRRPACALASRAGEPMRAC